MASIKEQRTCMKEDGLHLRPPPPSFYDPGSSRAPGPLEDLVGALELILDNVYSGIILCDKKSKILYINRFYADLLKTSKEKAIGKHIKTFFPESRLPEVIERGEIELGQKCSLRTDIALVVNRIPIKMRGETIGVLLQTVFRDYTEMNHLMARLKLLEKEVTYYKLGLDSMLSATYTFGSIIGKNARLIEAKRVAEKYARTDAAVLLTGATGTGKELFAHAVHLASKRKRGPFVCVNCSAIPKDLLESELFGYETGAFTGARQKGKAGKIELAHKGSLFLDEIGDIPIGAQSKLLRVLETKQIEKLGGLKSVEVDFRLIAATNRDLGGMMDHNEFRNAMTVEVPSLVERLDDIPELVSHFLRAMGRSELKVSDAAMTVLQNYPWPGNVRELKNTLERAVSLAEKGVLDLDHMPHEIRSFKSKCRQSPLTSLKPLSEELSCHEKEILVEALSSAKGNMAKTARLLGISRSTLYEKCKTHNI
jgi:transcriptional regulator with PAS, ATPase and Fis domain